MDEKEDFVARIQRNLEVNRMPVNIPVSQNFEEQMRMMASEIDSPDEDDVDEIISDDLNQTVMDLFSDEIGLAASGHLRSAL